MRIQTQRSLRCLWCKKKWRVYSQTLSKKSRINIITLRSGLVTLDLILKPSALSTWLMTRITTIFQEYTWIKFYQPSSWVKRKYSRPIFRFNIATSCKLSLKTNLTRSKISIVLSPKRKNCHQFPLLFRFRMILLDWIAELRMSMITSVLCSRMALREWVCSIGQVKIISQLCSSIRNVIISQKHWPLLKPSMVRSLVDILLWRGILVKSIGLPISLWLPSSSPSIWKKNLPSILLNLQLHATLRKDLSSAAVISA